MNKTEGQLYPIKGCTPGITPKKVEEAFFNRGLLGKKELIEADVEATVTTFSKILNLFIDKHKVPQG